MKKQTTTPSEPPSSPHNNSLIDDNYILSSNFEINTTLSGFSVNSSDVEDSSFARKEIQRRCAAGNRNNLLSR